MWGLQGSATDCLVQFLQVDILLAGNQCMQIEMPVIGILALCNTDSREITHWRADSAANRMKRSQSSDHTELEWAQWPHAKISNFSMFISMRSIYVSGLSWVIHRGRVMSNTTYWNYISLNYLDFTQYECVSGTNTFATICWKWQAKVWLLNA